MLKTFYEYENKKVITNDLISEYCMAEQLNEEYFRYNLRENETINHSVRNIMAAALLALGNIFKH
ncbi:MAG TPA: hypothetical protein PLA73_10505 [Sedimentibacter sp.]|jgi:hypothetical protein|nr:hypothetical protein [Sedimentibacter sp.]HQK54653.1 hypothetical protein [Sedimentibacter sp.]